MAFHGCDVRNVVSGVVGGVDVGQRVVTGTSREDLNGGAMATSTATGVGAVELDSKEGEKEKERLKLNHETSKNEAGKKGQHV